MVMRGKKRKGVRYYGPFAHAYAIRETLDLLLRTFPIRTCTHHKFRRHPRLGRPCLYAHIEKCAAPCVGRGDRGVRPAGRRLSGSSAARPSRSSTASRSACTRRPTTSSTSWRRGCATSWSRCARRSSASRWSAGPRSTRLVGLVDDPLEASVQVFLVRRGRVVGRKGSWSTRSRTSTAPGSWPACSSSSTAMPTPATSRSEVLVPRAPRTAALYEEFLWLWSAAGGCDVRVPQRGAKRACSRPSPATQRRRSTPQARAGLGPQRPRQGPDRAAGRPRPARSPAAHRVLRHLEPPGHRDRRLDGRDRGRSGRKRSDYRRFKIRHQSTARTTSPSMEDVLTRRFKRYLGERDEGARKGKRFSYPPNLLVIDGGKGQLGVAVAGARGARDSTRTSRRGLAKRFEEVYQPGHRRAGADPARLRGAVPAPAGARRGAPVRHHVPPPVAGQEDDQVGARRRARPRPDARRTRLLKRARLGEASRASSTRRPARAALAPRRGGPGALRSTPRPGEPGRDPGPGATAAGHRDGSDAGPTEEETSGSSGDDLDLTIVTGMSGAGRSTAAHVLEDLGLLRHRQPAAGADRQGRGAGPGPGPPQARTRSWSTSGRHLHRGARGRAGGAVRDRGPTPASCSSTRPTRRSCVATRRLVARTR